MNLNIDNTTLLDIDTALAMMDDIDSNNAFSDEFLEEEYNAFIKNDTGIKGLEEYMKTRRIGAHTRVSRKERKEVWTLCFEKFACDVEPLHIKTGTTCQRCQGTGMLQQFRHVAGGVCFTCGGTGEKASKSA